MSLLAYVTNTRHSLDSSVLETLANDYQVPSLDSTGLCLTLILRLIFIGPQLTNITAQPRKRARLVGVTADTHHEEATEQSQSIGGGQQAPVVTSILPGKYYPMVKNPWLPCLASSSLITTISHSRCLRPNRRRRKGHYDVRSNPGSNMVDESLQPRISPIYHDVNF